jgi:hypothetical protein
LRRILRSFSTGNKNGFDVQVERGKYDAIVSTVVREVLEDLVTATSISISVFSYFGSRHSLVEDKDDGPRKGPAQTCFFRTCRGDARYLALAQNSLKY